MSAFHDLDLVCNGNRLASMPRGAGGEWHVDANCRGADPGQFFLDTQRTPASSNSGLCFSASDVSLYSSTACGAG